MKRRSAQRLKLFVDENLSRQLVEVLKIYAHDTCDVIGHWERFAPGTPDEEWLGGIARWPAKPAILCGDGRILRNYVTLAALSSCLVSFVVPVDSFMRLDLRLQIRKMLAAWDELEAILAKERQPTLYEITVNSKVTAKCPMNDGSLRAPASQRRTGSPA